MQTIFRILFKEIVLFLLIKIFLFLFLNIRLAMFKWLVFLFIMKLSILWLLIMLTIEFLIEITKSKPSCLIHIGLFPICWWWLLLLLLIDSRRVIGWAWIVGHFPCGFLRETKNVVIFVRLCFVACWLCLGLVLTMITG